MGVTGPGDQSDHAPGVGTAYAVGGIAHASGILRGVLRLFALASLAFWGYLAWPFPWPAVGYIFGAPLFAILVWWLFRSANAPLPLDPVGKTVVEFLLLGSVVAAWFMLGYPIIAVGFGIIAAATSIISGRADIMKDRT